jgi:hypothetical protein
VLLRAALCWVMGACRLTWTMTGWQQQVGAVVGQACTGRQGRSSVSDQPLQCTKATRWTPMGQQAHPHPGHVSLGVAAGAVIAQRLRGAVAQQLAFTCSAGIGPNKLLAKIGSAKNKPNKQTVVLPRAIDSLMQVRGGGLCRSSSSSRQGAVCGAALWRPFPQHTVGGACCRHDTDAVCSILTVLCACVSAVLVTLHCSGPAPEQDQGAGRQAGCKA